MGTAQPKLRLVKPPPEAAEAEPEPGDTPATDVSSRPFCPTCGDEAVEDSAAPAEASSYERRSFVCRTCGPITVLDLPLFDDDEPAPPGTPRVYSLDGVDPSDAASLPLQRRRPPTRFADPVPPAGETVSQPVAFDPTTDADDRAAAENPETLQGSDGELPAAEPDAQIEQASPVSLTHLVELESPLEEAPAEPRAEESELRYAAAPATEDDTASEDSPEALAPETPGEDAGPLRFATSPATEDDSASKDSPEALVPETHGEEAEQCSTPESDAHVPEAPVGQAVSDAFPPDTAFVEPVPALDPVSADLPPAPVEGEPEIPTAEVHAGVADATPFAAAMPSVDAIPAPAARFALRGRDLRMALLGSLAAAAAVLAAIGFGTIRPFSAGVQVASAPSPADSVAPAAAPEGIGLPPPAGDAASADQAAPAETLAPTAAPEALAVPPAEVAPADEVVPAGSASSDEAEAPSEGTDHAKASDPPSPTGEAAPAQVADPEAVSAAKPAVVAAANPEKPEPASAPRVAPAGPAPASAPERPSGVEPDAAQTRWFSQTGMPPTREHAIIDPGNYRPRREAAEPAAAPEPEAPPRRPKRPALPVEAAPEVATYHAVRPNPFAPPPASNGWYRLEAGLTPQQVLDVLGRPRWKANSIALEFWMYEVRSIMGAGVVVFDNGVVYSWQLPSNAEPLPPG